MKITDLFRPLVEDAAQDVLVIKFAEYIYDMLRRAIKNEKFEESMSGQILIKLANVLLQEGIRTHDDFEIQPPDWIEIDDLRRLLIGLLPSKTDGTEGGFGHRKETNEPFILIFSLLPGNIHKHMHSRFRKSVVVHELIHFFDSIRSKTTTNFNSAKFADNGNTKDYYLNASEFNAYYQETVSGIMAMFNSKPPTQSKFIKKVLGSGFDGFYRFFILRMPSAYKKYESKYRRKIQKRVYGLYQELVQRFVSNGPTTEGMDNANFLTKNIGAGPTIYPLPTNSKKFTNINSKRRGGAKVKARKLKESEVGYVIGWYNPNSSQNISTDHGDSPSGGHAELWYDEFGIDVSDGDYEDIYDDGWMRYLIINNTLHSMFSISGNDDVLKAAALWIHNIIHQFDAPYEMYVNDKQVA
jgi:hypothetical protein